MQPKTTAHLEQVEKIVDEAHKILSKHAYPDNTRTVLVAGFLATMIELHGAMLRLIRDGKVGAAFALARSIVESMYRGMYMNFVATDPEVQQFEATDEFPIKMRAMAQALDKAYHAGDFFEDLYNRGWAALCSYTHSGMLQLGRRFTGHNLQPNYTDEEIYAVTTTVTTCVLLLACKFLAVQNQVNDSKTVEALIGTYGPVAATKASPAAPTATP
jgi:hypothetical protein